MPHATSKYPFEWKILDWAARLSQQLEGHPHYPFLMLFRAEGGVAEIHFGEAPEQHDDRRWQELMAATPSWFAYDPFEGPEYTFLHWQQVPRAVFERLLGAAFVPADFTSGNESIEFPSTWSVMF